MAKIKRSMVMVPPSLQCRLPDRESHLEVVQVVNSTRFAPGEWVHKTEVDKLISEGWTITIKGRTTT